MTRISCYYRKVFRPEFPNFQFFPPVFVFFRLSFVMGLFFPKQECYVDTVPDSCPLLTLLSEKYFDLYPLFPDLFSRKIRGNIFR